MGAYMPTWMSRMKWGVLFLGPQVLIVFEL